MARLFELVLNAGPDRAAAEQVAACLTDLPALPAGPHRVSVTPQPSIRVMRGDDGLDYQEVSVAAIGPGWVTTRTAWRSLQLTEDELTHLALGLYEALRRCDGYRAAVVGWGGIPRTSSISVNWPSAGRKSCQPEAASLGSCCPERRSQRWE